MQSVAIGIAGGSCSGKSTLAHQLMSHFGSSRAALLPQDDYFYGLSEAPKGKGGTNFDHPRAVKFELMADHLQALKSGQRCERPEYDFTAHMPKPDPIVMDPKPIIIVDGTLIMHDENVRAMLDYKIFVSAASATRLARRLERDTRDRGRTATSVREQFAQFVAPMHEAFVEPSRTHADFILDGNIPTAEGLSGQPPMIELLAILRAKVASNGEAR